MRKKTLLIGVIGIVIGLLLAAAGIVAAGSLNPSGPPGSTFSYTLADIYNRLNAGTAGTQSTFTEPAAGPGTATMYSLNDIMARAPAVDATNGAVAAEVLTGKSFWGLTTGAWGLRTGTAAQGSNVSGADGSKSFSIPDGFYSGKAATANDSDLVAGNIKSGVDIFGVAGTLTPGGIYNARVPKTGAGAIPGYTLQAGEDGLVQQGVPWPNPRFTANVDNSNDGDCTDPGETCNGTVTDNLTGLIWLKNANCDGTKTWVNALAFANGLASGSCGLSDGSTAGQWRLPNVREQQSLIDYGRLNPPLPSGHPFTGVQSGYYWTSTTYADAVFPSYAWVMRLDAGSVDYASKTASLAVWPVRGGQ